MKNKETVAQEALRLLKDIPEDEFITEKFTDTISKCCVLGHYRRLKSNNPEDYSAANIQWRKEGEELRQLSIDFSLKIHKTYLSIASVNNRDLSYQAVNKFYKQETPKARSIAMLENMVKAGY